MGKKLQFKKLGFNTKDVGVDIYYWNRNKKLEIEIKQFIPVEEKLNIVSSIINKSVDDNGYYNAGKLEIFTCLEIIENYTNVSFTDEQKEDPTTLYDLMYWNGFFDKIFSFIPEEEIDFIRSVTKETIKSIYAYKNSAVGILETVSNDYEGLSFEVNDLYEKIRDPENLDLLKAIVTKLG